MNTGPDMSPARPCGLQKLWALRPQERRERRGERQVGRRERSPEILQEADGAVGEGRRSGLLPEFEGNTSFLGFVL